MKVIHNLGNLESYGVNLLTGEADRLSMRILCDLNVEGKQLVCDFLGLPHAVKLSDSWNSVVNCEPAVASIMLTRQTLWEIAVFAMLTVDNFDVVIGYPEVGIRGGNYDDNYTTHYMKLYGEDTKSRVHRNYAKTSTAPGSGSRNEHAMSGRTL